MISISSARPPPTLFYPPGTTPFASIGRRGRVTPPGIAAAAAVEAVTAEGVAVASAGGWVAAQGGVVVAAATADRWPPAPVVAPTPVAVG